MDGRHPSAQPTRVGIVGAGSMGRWHADAAARTGATVVGVADTDEARARALARRYPGASVHPDLHALLAPGDLDVVHVCTPLAEHRELAGAALESGKSVLVEKPLAPDVATTRALIETARANGGQLCPVHQFPFQRGFRRARAASLSAGGPAHVELTMCSAGGIGRDEAGLRALVAEILPHPLSIVRSLFPSRSGAVEWLAESRRAGELLLRGGVDDVSIVVSISLASRPTESSLRLRGADGTWEVDLFHGFATRMPAGVSRRRKILLPFERAARVAGGAAANLVHRALRREPAYPGLRTLVAEFHAAARGEGEPPISLAEIDELACASAAIQAQLQPS